MPRLISIASHPDQGIVVAYEGEKLAGYLFPIVQSFNPQEAARLDRLILDDKPLASYTWCMGAQVCVDHAYRNGKV